MEVAVETNERDSRGPLVHRGVDYFHGFPGCVEESNWVEELDVHKGLLDRGFDRHRFLESCVGFHRKVVRKSCDEISGKLAETSTLLPSGASNVDHLHDGDLMALFTNGKGGEIGRRRCQRIVGGRAFNGKKVGFGVGGGHGVEVVLSGGR